MENQSAPQSLSVQQTLSERGKRYGTFESHSLIAQSLKSVMALSANWPSLTTYQKQALEVIADKIARILNGDPNYLDNWHDIAGYSLLVEDILAKLNQTSDQPS